MALPRAEKAPLLWWQAPWRGETSAVHTAGAFESHRPPAMVEKMPDLWVQGGAPSRHPLPPDARCQAALCAPLSTG
jgi:hypothetical protein